MLNIGYNNSNKHIGPKKYYECPERIEYAIKQLLQDYDEIYFLDFETNFDEAITLIKNVHTGDYINQIINIIPRYISCRKCNFSMKNIEGNFNDFIKSKEICYSCKNNLSVDNVFCYLDNDTYYTFYTFDVIIEAICVLKNLIDNIKNNKINYGYALIRPPGHHCCNKPSGFCIVNNVVIAGKYAQSLGYQKVLILDIDFHHGDGTAELLKSIDSMYLVSIHGYGESIYPGTGSQQESTENILNIPLPISKLNKYSRLYINDEFYINLIYNKVVPFIQKINPDLIIISNGLDGHRDDPLEGFNITDDTYINIVKILKTFSKPLLFVTEGGYSIETIYRVSKKMIDELKNEL